MLKSRKNKCALIFYAIAILCLLLAHASLDKFLSGIIRKTEGAHISNFTEEAEVLGELTADVVLRQEVKLPEGVLRLGVLLDTYMRKNGSSYQIILYDNEGNVAAKRTVQAGSVEDGQMCYIQLYGRTSSKISYLLEITSSDAAPGDAITAEAVPVREGHASCTLNGKSTEKELVIDLALQKNFPVAYGLAGLFTFGLLLFLCREKIQIITGQFTYKIRIFWKNQKKKIIYTNLILASLGIIIIMAFQKEGYRVVRGSSAAEDSTVVCPYEGKMRQNFQSGIAFDAIEVRLATYTVKYQQGTIRLALHEEATGSVLAEKTIAAGVIEDNSFLRFDLAGVLPEGQTEYYFELWTEDFGTQPLGIYYADNGEKLQYRLLKKDRSFRAAEMTVFAGWGIFWLLVCVYTMIPVQKKYRQLVVVSATSIFAGLLFSAYANYKSIHPEAFAKNLGITERGDALQYDKEEIENNTERIYRYNAEGKVYVVFDQISLFNVWTNIDTIELYLEPVNFTKKNLFAVYVDYGNDFGRNAAAELEYIYRGQEKIVIPITCSKRAERIRISYNMINENGISEETLKSDFQFYSLKKITLNEKRAIWYEQWQAILAGILLIWLVYFWKKCNIEQLLENWLHSGKSREAKVFFVIALLFGTVFSVLLPVYQVPDEPVHIKWAFQSIGAQEIYTQVVDLADEAVEKVMQNGANIVNADRYREIWKTVLESYQLPMKLSLDALRYPGQIIGIVFAAILHLPMGWMLFSAEFLALLLYCVIGAAAIRLAPVKKELFMMVLLMPMAIQQAGSFSYDSFNNAMAVLTIAYLLYLALEKEKTGIRELGKAAAALFILLWIKKVYVVCGLLILLIPIKKYDISVFGKKLELTSRKVQLLLAGGACFCGAIFFMIISRHSAVATMLETVSYPAEIGKLVLETVNAQFRIWLKQGTAEFGWMDGTFYSWIIAVVIVGLLSAAVLAAETSALWNGRKYFLCLCAFLICTTGIIFSMFGWTAQLLNSSGSVLNQMLLFPSIEGVQGRYFLPILVLIFLFPVAKWMQRLRKHIPVYLILILVTVTTVGYSIYMLLHRYWIA